MQSRVSFCNGALLRKNLLRFIPLWAAYLALWLVILPLSLYSNITAYSNTFADVQHTIFQTAVAGGTFMNLFYAILTVMALFAFLYGSRSVNTIAALPVRRETLYLNNVLTGLLVGIVPLVITALATWAVTAVCGFAMGGTVLQWLAITVMQYLFFFGLACVCACFVGHLLALPILYMLLNFSAIVLNYLVVQILSTFVYGMTSSGHSAYILSPLSPVVELIGSSRFETNWVMQSGMEVVSSYSFTRWGYVAILAGVGVAAVLVGFLLFRRRHMETAGDVIAVRPLRPVFKYCFTAGSSIVLGMLAASTIFSGVNNPSIYAIGACLLLGGFVGYFGAEMLLKKTVHVFGRPWIGFGIFSLCLLSCICLMEFDAFGYERRVPGISEVESVQITANNYNGGTCTVTDEAYMLDIITLHQQVIHEKSRQEQLFSNTDDSDTLSLMYMLKNGDILMRSYEVYALELDWRDDTSLIRQFEAVYNDPHLVELRYSPNENLTAKNISAATISGPKPRDEKKSTEVRDSEVDWFSQDLTYDEAYTLYTECILPDIRDGNLGKANFYAGNRLYASERNKYANSITIRFDRTEKGPDGREFNYSSYIDVTISKNAARTVAYLNDLGIELVSEYNAEDSLYQ